MSARTADFKLRPTSTSTVTLWVSKLPTSSFHRFISRNPISMVTGIIQFYPRIRIEITHLSTLFCYSDYDLERNEGWVSVGLDHDTAQFATATIERWWRKMGRRVYDGARRLLITADGGGSNGSRHRLWKWGLQQVADRLGLEISVCHFPPGTSKWNKIEHRMFCHITENWRGRPLVSHAVVVNLIGGTRTRTGLRIQAELDTNPGLTHRFCIGNTDRVFSSVFREVASRGRKDRELRV